MQVLASDKAPRGFKDRWVIRCNGRYRIFGGWTAHVMQAQWWDTEAEAKEYARYARIERYETIQPDKADQ